MEIKITNKDKGFNESLIKIISPILNNERLFKIFIRMENTTDKESYINSTLDRFLISEYISNDEKNIFIDFYIRYLEYVKKPKHKKGDFLEYIVTKAFEENSIISYEPDIYNGNAKIGNKYFDNIVCNEESKQIVKFIYLEGVVYFIECKHNINTFLHRKQPATKALEKLDYIKLIYEEVRGETSIDASFKIITFIANVDPSNEFMKNNEFKGNDYEFINVISIEDIEERLFC